MIRRATALAVVVATAYVVRQHGPADGEARTMALAAGFALVAAALAGDFVEKLRLPRVSGYLLFGLAAGPYFSNVISRPMARELRLIDGVAVALIAMIAGLEMNVLRLKPRIIRMLQVGGITIAILFAVLFVGLYAAWPWLPILPGATGALRFAMAFLFATVVTSFSPTVTIAVMAENRAAGPLSELTLAVVVLGDLLLVLLFGVSMQLVRTATGAASQEVGLFVHLSWEIVGSMAFGATVGALLALYLRAIGRELAIVLVACCVVLSEVGAWMRFEPVLAALVAGLIVENVAPPRGDALRRAVERSALPILIVFFAAAGASLQLDALRTVGFVAGALALARLLLIRIGTSAGARVAGIEGSLVWRGLVSQAGLTLGLTVIVASEYPTWGAPLQTIMVAMIALHELVGPVLFRSALARAGEIGRADLTGADASIAPESGLAGAS